MSIGARIKRLPTSKKNPERRVFELYFGTARKSAPCSLNLARYIQWTRQSEESGGNLVKHLPTVVGVCDFCTFPYEQECTFQSGCIRCTQLSQAPQNPYQEDIFHQNRSEPMDVTRSNDAKQLIIQNKMRVKKIKKKK
jgi:hypothetical protein